MNINEIITKDKCYPFSLDENTIDKILRIFNIDKEFSDNATLINIADIQHIIKNKAFAVVGITEFSHKHTLKDSPIKLLNCITDNFLSIQNCEGIVIQFSVSPNYPEIELAKCMDVICESTNDDIEIISSTASDESLLRNYMKITVLAV